VLAGGQIEAQVPNGMAEEVYAAITGGTASMRGSPDRSATSYRDRASSTGPSTSSGQTKIDAKPPSSSLRPLAEAGGALSDQAGLASVRGLPGLGLVGPRHDDREPAIAPRVKRLRPWHKQGAGAAHNAVFCVQVVVSLA